MGFRPRGNEDRWRPRRFTAALLRVLIFVVPIGAGFTVGAMVARALPNPGSVYEIVFWWVAVVSVATVTSTAVDRLGRRLLPLTVLLRMTMLFPDAAPSRLRLARRAGNVSELRRRIVEAGRGTGDTNLGEMAELVLSLSTALSNHDRKTRGHSERTRAYTDMIAEEMGIPEHDRDRLRWAALLHDVGKLEVPTEILNKDSALSDDEWELVKQHPLNGMKLVAPLIPWLGSWAETIEHHHERYDGTGYPHGFVGEDICLGARIVSVADAYDVMTSGRSYQKALSPSAARIEITRMSGRQFDPVVARALMNVSLGRLRWTTGPLAFVAQIPFIRGLPQVGRDVAMVVTTSAILTTGFVTGAVQTPDGLGVTPAEIIEVVIAGAGLRGSELPPGIPDRLPLAAGATDFPGEATADDADESADPGSSSEPNGDGGTPGTAGVPGSGTTTTSTDPPPDPTTTTAPPPDTTTTTAPPPDTTTTSVGAAPIARDDSATTREDEPVTINVLANDTDADGDLDPSTLTIVSAPGMGSAIVTANSNVRYTPAPNRNGTDRFTYRVCDRGGRCDTATVTVIITPVNDPPVAPPRSATVDAGGVTVIPLGYTDPDGDVLTCAMTGPPAFGAATVPADCSELQYSAPAGSSGIVTITIRVSDGTVSVEGVVTITVRATNRPPVAVPDSAATSGAAISIPVLANDYDPDGDPITLMSVSAPSSGSTAHSGNTVTYTPATGFTGTANFTYQVCDPGGLCATGSVSVSVTAASSSGPVVANDDSASVKQNGTVTLSILSNDTGPIDTSTLSVGAPSSGSVSVLGSSGRVRYDGAPGFIGVTTFSYTVCSATGACDSATVTIEVG